MYHIQQKNVLISYVNHANTDNVLKYIFPFLSWPYGLLFFDDEIYSWCCICLLTTPRNIPSLAFIKGKVLSQAQVKHKHNPTHLFNPELEFMCRALKRSVMISESENWRERKRQTKKNVEKRTFDKSRFAGMIDYSF